MAKCPRCRAKQAYSRLLFLRGNKTLVCEQCGTSLRLNKLKLFPYLLIVTFVAAILGMAMVISKDYVTTIVLLVIWILTSLAVYPLVLSLVFANDEQA